jgi:hypothetical protein
MVSPDTDRRQVWIQAKACCLTIVWSGVVSLVAYKIVDLVIGLRVRKRKSAKAWTSPRTARPPTQVKPAGLGGDAEGLPAGSPFSWHPCHAAVARPPSA